MQKSNPHGILMKTLSGLAAAMIGLGASVSLAVGPDHPILLNGTVTGDPTRARAVVRHPDTGVETLLRLGDRIAGWRLVEIQRDRIVIEQDGRQQVVRIHGGKGSATAQRPRPVVLSREQVDQALGQAARQLRSVSVKPNTTGGMGGLELVRVEPGSLAEQLGFMPGDVVRRINGADIERPRLLSLLYEGLKQTPMPLALGKAAQTVGQMFLAADDQSGGVVAQTLKLERDLMNGQPVDVLLERQGRMKNLTFQLER
jgi:hypothetical protein